MVTNDLYARGILKIVLGDRSIVNHETFRARPFALKVLSGHGVRPPRNVPRVSGTPRESSVSLRCFLTDRVALARANRRPLVSVYGSRNTTVSVPAICSTCLNQSLLSWKANNSNRVDVMPKSDCAYEGPTVLQCVDSHTREDDAATRMVCIPNCL